MKDNLFNKIAFLSYHHFLKHLIRYFYLFKTVIKSKKIISEIVKHKNVKVLGERFSAKHNIAIHILCSHDDLESLILSLVSFYYFSSEYARVVVHDDGSFKVIDRLIISSVFPWVRFVGIAEADKTLKEKGFSEAVINLRRTNKILIKAIDFHYIEVRDRVLVIDSDVFVIGPLRELWGRIERGNNFVFIEDLSAAYGGAKELLESALGRLIDIQQKPYVNTGLIVEPSDVLRSEKHLAEEYCHKFREESFSRKHCIEQGLVACLLKYRKQEESVLPDSYKIVSNKDNELVKWLNSYDLNVNPDKIEVLHLCGWDKRGKYFLSFKNRLLKDMLGRLKNRVIFYPACVLEWPNPFWRLLKSSIEESGLYVSGMSFSILNLIRQAGRIKIIHFHYVYPQPLYGFFTGLPRKIWNFMYRVSGKYQEISFVPRLRFAKFLGYRIIYTVHNLLPHENSRFIKQNTEALYRLSDAVVVMGECDRAVVREFIPENKIRIIPFFRLESLLGAVPEKGFSRERFNLPQDKRIYLCFGNIRRYKGFDIAIKVFKDLQIDALLVIAGDPSEDPGFSDELRNLAEGEKRIKLFLHKLSDEEINLFISSCDVAVFPFRGISNSASWITAKSFYKPTIVSEKGNIREYASPLTDMLINDEFELKESIVASFKTDFSFPREEYLRNIPPLPEVAAMYSKVYNE